MVLWYIYIIFLFNKKKPYLQLYYIISERLLSKYQMRTRVHCLWTDCRVNGPNPASGAVKNENLLLIGFLILLLFVGRTIRGSAYNREAAELNALR